MALSLKHQRFVDEYLTTWNATDAYQAAYPKVNRATARANGARLLANANIAEEIKQRVAERTMSADEVLVRLTEQARSDYAAYITPNGTVDMARLVNDGKAHLVKAIKETQHARNIEFYDAQAALMQLGKHHGLLVERTEVTGAGGGPVKTQDVGIDYSKLSDEQIAELIRIAEFAQSQKGAGAA